MLFGPPHQRTFGVELWDGSADGPTDAPFTLILRNPQGVRRMLLPPTELRIAEAYVLNDIDVAGSLEAATALGDLFGGRAHAVKVAARLLPQLLALPSRSAAEAAQIRALDVHGADAAAHDLDRDKEAIRFHYDVGNDFYALWLGRRMVYSCAYFLTGNESLDDAQTAKLDLICHKLQLKPDDRLLDIGCGWGALVCHAATAYGAHATGITLSQAQAGYARRAIANAGATGAQVEVRDYREMDERVVFDRIASIGMVEHVGRAHLDAYFAKAFALLRPGGLFLNHGIVALDDARSPSLGKRLADRVWSHSAFIHKYVFPNGEILQLAEMVRAAEAAGFETRHVETLREHYATTLRHWLGRLEGAHEQAAALVGEQVYRVWRLYLAASAKGFADGQLGVVQMVLARPSQ